MRTRPKYFSSFLVFTLRAAFACSAVRTAPTMFVFIFQGGTGEQCNRRMKYERNAELVSWAVSDFQVYDSFLWHIEVVNVQVVRHSVGLPESRDCERKRDLVLLH